ncbi:MAG: amino acid ABC transporter permease [Rhodoglobus sp.]
MLIVVCIAVWMVTTPRFEWDVVAGYMFSPLILNGIGMTLLLTAVCIVLGCVLGVVLAVMRLSNVAVFRLVSSTFVWFFRAVPMLVQLLFWFNLSYLVPRIIVGIPFGPEFFSWDTNDVINAFTAAVIGLTIHEAAYMSEIIRSGILSVDSGQRDAARALGYREGPIFVRFILPQALRVIIPPTGSQVISLLKGTSLVSVIGMTDLLHAAQGIYNRTFEVVPLLLVASIWYLILVGILSYVQGRIETRLSRGYRPSTGKASSKQLKKSALDARSKQ